jgi:hypothetical protein
MVFFGLLKLKPFSMSASGYGKGTHEQIGWYQTVVKASACTVSKGITNLQWSDLYQYPRMDFLFAHNFAAEAGEHVCRLLLSALK